MTLQKSSIPECLLNLLALRTCPSTTKICFDGIDFATIFTRMTASTNETVDPNQQDDQWVKVGQYPSIDQAFEHSLVILSQGSSCRVHRSAAPTGDYELEAPSDRETIARRELEAYEAENQQPHTPSLADAAHDFGIVPLLLWAIALLFSYRMQLATPFWEEIGMNSSVDLIENHQWWRPLTALFLHADAGHLLSNLLTGSLFAVVLHRYWGTGRTWSALIVCGVLGNIANSLIRYPEKAFSLGASTAVMAALGLLCSHGTYFAISQRKISKSFRQATIPLAAGIALFGLTGNSAEPDVNVLGHACGFAAGVIAGMPIAWNVNHRNRSSP